MEGELRVGLVFKTVLFVLIDYFRGTQVHSCGSPFVSMAI